MCLDSDLRKTPPRSDALRHSGGDRRLWTSATVTLYLDVELSRERRPGTEQNTSVGLDTMPNRDSFWKGRPSALPLGRVTGPGRWGGKIRIKKTKTNMWITKDKGKKRGPCEIVCLCIDIFLCVYSILSNHRKPFSATGESVFSGTSVCGSAPLRALV